jgi:UDP-N-acetylmuramate--alanine ligase
MTRSIDEFQYPFFIGIAGAGMSAIAQYLQGIGKKVSGSDRFFQPGEPNEIKGKLQADGIACFPQTGEGIIPQTDLVVVSTAVEDSVVEVQIARQRNIPIIKRSELLALIASSKKTIAVGGTSGKSTTCAMLFDILEYAGLQPSIISGAGLVSLIRKGKIGNAMVGAGEWLVIEADESDGSIVHYQPEIGLLLNVEKDHKELDALREIFKIFRDNSRKFIVNQSYPATASLSQDIRYDFSVKEKGGGGYKASDFQQQGLTIRFSVNEIPFHMNLLGTHNMENALAAVAVANQLGVDLSTCAKALEQYEGIYRRNQVLGNKNGVWVIDDFAHNPVKCAAAIRACQPVASKVIAWFQPHGYGPTKFLRHDFVEEIASVLRPVDEIWMSEIFYAGGTAVKDISAGDLIADLKAKNCQAFFVEHRSDFLKQARPHFNADCVILLMGARDPSLENFAQQVWEQL